MFRDRVDAGSRLARALSRLRGRRDVVVLAVPRGGVAVGAVLARELGVPLSAVLVKKIVHPLYPETAVGAVGLTGAEVDPRAAVSQGYVDREVRRLQAALRLKGKAYGIERPLELAGKTVVLVDDGAATGHTLMAAAELVGDQGARELVIAVPVAPPEVAERLARECDELVVLEEPEDFAAVGQFYEDFRPVEDAEAARLLEEARAWKPDEASGRTRRG